MGIVSDQGEPARAVLRSIPLEEICIDGDTQVRVDVNPERVAEYSERYGAGYHPQKPVTVVSDGEHFWLADGFHRFYAARRAGLTELRARVVPGTQAAAFDIGVAENLDNGEPLSAADRRRIVSVWLKRDSGQSNRCVAGKLKISENTVATIRAELVATGQIAQSDHRTGRDGRRINTANIGKTGAGDAPPRPLAEAPPPVPDEPEREPLGERLPPLPIEPDPRNLPTDKVGNPIPNDSIAEAFRREHELVEKSSLVTKLKSDVLRIMENNDPLYGDIIKTQFEVDCNNLRRQFEHARPYAICPYCWGDGCKACHGRGWANEVTWKMAPWDCKTPRSGAAEPSI